MREMKNLDQQKRMYYLDYNATTPVDPAVREAIVPYLTQHFGNPSSSYGLGQVAAEAVKQAREQIRSMLDADEEDRIIFMSGGTETINYVLKGCTKQAYDESKGARNHIVTSAIEHVAVLETCKYLEANGFEVTYLPVNSSGHVDPADVEKAIQPSTILVSIMHSNNETGALQPIREIVDIIHKKSLQVLFHTDASQSIGKVPVSTSDLGVDFLTIAGHKLYAPKGIGALYIRKGIPIPQPLVHGASHEFGFRAGTENVPFCAGLGKACELVRESISTTTAELAAMRNLLLKRLQESCRVPLRVNSPMEKSLPNTLNISFKGLLAQDILSGIQEHVAASAGSACHSAKEGDGTVHVSHVLRAMKIPDDYIRGTLRLSVGRFTTELDIEQAACLLADQVNNLLYRTRAINDLERVNQEKNMDMATPPTKRLYHEDTYRFTSTARFQCMKWVPHGHTSKSSSVLHATEAVVLLDQTIVHPQGGGQPSDVGEIKSVETGTRFLVTMARFDRTSDCVFHYGSFVSGTSFVQGEEVIVTIDEEARRLHARLHSAGHLIDKALSDLKYDFKPSKGYHFPDSPFVEYEGDLSPEQKENMVENLNKKCQELMDASIPTVVEECCANRVKQLCDGCDTSHLPKDQSIRMVSIAGYFGPCGGTHVANTSEIQKLHIIKVKGRNGKFKISYTL